jgi:catechol 2,3-dioxygenase-like lactoylglutathione lyase family enzyme
MILKRIDHITINVKDLEASLSFYRDIAGLERLETIDMGDHVLDYMGLPGGTRLELISYKYDTREMTTVETDSGILRHIAFSVDSVAEIVSRCERFGAKIKLRPQYVAKLGCEAMLVEDPNGVELEFMQK